MNYLIAQNSVALGSGDTYPTTGSPGEATSGNPNATPVVPATNNPAFFANMIQRELGNLIEAAGLTLNGQDWTQLKQAIFAIGGGNIVVFESPGTGVFTPPADWTRCACLVIGGGGAGGNGNGAVGGGGQGGGAALGIINFAAGSTIPYLVGAGGAASGESGGTSSVLGLTATGGTGGGNGTPGYPATTGGYLGGQGSGTALTFLGGAGGIGVATSEVWFGGQGGNSLVGQGGPSPYTDGSSEDSENGSYGDGYGAGGSGGVNAGVGGTGFTGLVAFFGPGGN